MNTNYKYRSEVRRHARKKKPPGRRKHTTDISSTTESISVSDGAPMETVTVLTTLSSVTTTTSAATGATITIPLPDFMVTAVASPLLQTQTSTSAKKLDLDASIKIKVDESEVDGIPTCYLFMDTSILLDLVELIGTCPVCYRKTKVKLRHDIEKKKGLAHFITLSCVKCNWSKTFATSKTV